MVWGIVGKPRVLAPVLVATLVLLGACGARYCTLSGAVPVVAVDTTDFPIDNPEDVEVCLDGRCVPLFELEVPTSIGGGSATTITVAGDNSERTIAIRRVTGQVLAGPTEVELGSFRPNGDGCPPEVLQGLFQVDANGVIGPYSGPS